jgi:hypothetical protein
MQLRIDIRRKCKKTLKPEKGPILHFFAEFKFILQMIRNIITFEKNPFFFLIFKFPSMTYKY